MSEAVVLKPLGSRARSTLDKIVGAAELSETFSVFYKAGEVHLFDVLNEVKSSRVLRALGFSRPDINKCGGIYGCKSASEHTDSVPYDVTVGYVISGDHVLYCGNDHEIGALKRGSVYVLNNKVLHSALPAKNDSPPLIFVAIDVAICDVREVVRCLRYNNGGVK